MSNEMRNLLIEIYNRTFQDKPKYDYGSHEFVPDFGEDKVCAIYFAPNAKELKKIKDWLTAPDFLEDESAVSSDDVSISDLIDAASKRFYGFSVIPPETCFESWISNDNSLNGYTICNAYCLRSPHFPFSVTAIILGNSKNDIYLAGKQLVEGKRNNEGLTRKIISIERLADKWFAAV